MTDRPVLEAVGEVLAMLDGAREAFRENEDVREFYLPQAQEFIDCLARSGYALSPTPIVNAGEDTSEYRQLVAGLDRVIKETLAKESGNEG